MAQVANTYETYDAVGNREELADKIYQITPEETPFLSLIGRKPSPLSIPNGRSTRSARSILNNNQPEGNDWTYDAIVPTSRVGNYTQISDKKIIISRTQDKTSKAGRKSELAREVAKKGVELRIDMEAITLSATRHRPPAPATARPTASSAPSARGWRPTTASAAAAARRAASTPRPALLTRRPTAPSAPSPRRFWMRRSCPPTTRAASPRTLMVSPYVKTVFSTFMSDTNVANQRYETPQKGQTTIVAAADMYLSDFGPVSVVPNRQMARAGATVARNAFLIDPRMVSLGVFDDIQHREAGQDGRRGEARSRHRIHAAGQQRSCPRRCR
jgi:hypothetical protein